MLITILVEAKYISEGQAVRKPTGTKPYVMRRDGIKIYTFRGLQVFGAGVFYMQSEEHIQMVGADTFLAVDFESPRAAETFLGDLSDEY